MKGNEKKQQENLCITAGSEENLSGKETEQSICRTLTEMEIPFQIIHHPPVYTSADCTEIEKTLQTSGCKNLFLRNSSGASWNPRLSNTAEFPFLNIGKNLNDLSEYRFIQQNCHEQSQKA